MDALIVILVFIGINYLAWWLIDKGKI